MTQSPSTDKAGRAGPGQAGPEKPAAREKTAFTVRVIALIQQIPPGRVATYGLIAAWAGDHRAARQVARILHSCSDKEELPWHRVVNHQGKIALGPCSGYEVQRALLEQEGVQFNLQGRIDFEKYLWIPKDKSSN